MMKIALQKLTHSTRQTRRALKSINLVVLLVFFFTACQPTSPESFSRPPSTKIAATNTPAPTITPQPTSGLNVEEDALQGITVEVWHPWRGAEASLFDQQVGDFNRINPWGITVQSEGMQTYTELFARVNPTIYGPDRPDVVIGLPEHALIWAGDDAVLDLNPYASDPVYGLSDVEISDFPSVFWAQDEVNGIRYGVPAQRTARFILYNLTWARELGFDSPPANADEFMQQACAGNISKLADENPGNDGTGGWLVDTHPMTSLSWLLALGGGVVEEESFRFLTPENIDALRFVKGLSESGCAWSSSAEQPILKFVDRSALFATASLEEFPDIARIFAREGSFDEWTILPFPGHSGSIFVIYGSSYIQFKSDETDQLAAWLFIRWMLQAENQAKWVRSTGLFPLRASTLNQVSDYSTGHPQWARAASLVPQGRLTPQLPEWKTVRVMLGDGFNHMFRVEVPTGQVPAILAQMDAIVSELNK
jgi:multiple sugar transport system substrate-binding protein